MKAKNSIVTKNDPCNIPYGPILKWKTALDTELSFIQPKCICLGKRFGILTNPTASGEIRAACGKTSQLTARVTSQEKKRVKICSKR